MPKTILILGANLSGVIVANKLARELRREIARDDVEIVLLDKNDIFEMQGMFAFIPFHAIGEEDAAASRRELVDPRVKYIYGADGEVSKIDLANRHVDVASGKRYRYDYLVIATGAELVPDLVPGLTKDYHTFYSYEGALELRELLLKFTGGTIVQLFVEPPIKCPIAPLKFSLLLDDYLRDRGIRRKTEIIALYPVDHLHAQPAVNELGERMCNERGIKYVYNFEASEVDAENKTVVSTKGEKVKYDLLITVPPHRGTKAIKESGIGDPYYFVPCDRYTLQYRKGKVRYEEVYTLGDATALEVAKAAAVAHYQSDVVVHNIIADIRKTGRRKIFRGETICPLISNLYTAADRGRGWFPWWNYVKNADPFIPTRVAWLLIKLYYLASWSWTLKGLA